jgi:hypothetical protein
MKNTDITGAVRDGAARAVAAVGLAGVALIHLLDAPGKFAETPYMGWMYIALMAGCLVVAADLVVRGSRMAWAGAVVLPLSALVGFTLTRTVGLPQAHEDIGNWGEPLGMASLFVEGCLVAFSAAALLVPAWLSRPTQRAAGNGSAKVRQNLDRGRFGRTIADSREA